MHSHLEVPRSELTVLIQSSRFMPAWGEHLDHCDECYEKFVKAVTISDAQESPASVEPASHGWLVLSLSEDAGARSLGPHPRLRWLPMATTAAALLLALCVTWLVDPRAQSRNGDGEIGSLESVVRAPVAYVPRVVEALGSSQHNVERLPMDVRVSEDFRARSATFIHDTALALSKEVRETSDSTATLAVDDHDSVPSGTIHDDDAAEVVREIERTVALHQRTLAQSFDNISEFSAEMNEVARAIEVAANTWVANPSADAEARLMKAVATGAARGRAAADMLAENEQNVNELVAVLRESISKSRMLVESRRGAVMTKMELTETTLQRLREEREDTARMQDEVSEQKLLQLRSQIIEQEALLSVYQRTLALIEMFQARVVSLDAQIRDFEHDGEVFANQVESWERALSFIDHAQTLALRSQRIEDALGLAKEPQDTVATLRRRVGDALDSSLFSVHTDLKQGYEEDAPEAPDTLPGVANPGSESGWRIRGLVLYSDGVPAANVTLIVESTAQEGKAAETDEGGVFELVIPHSSRRAEIHALDENGTCLSSAVASPGHLHPVTVELPCASTEERVVLGGQ